MLFIRDTKYIGRESKQLADFSEQPMYEYPQPQPDLSRSLNAAWRIDHIIANFYPTINEAFLDVW